MKYLLTYLISAEYPDERDLSSWERIFGSSAMFLLSTPFFVIFLLAMFLI